MMLEIQQVKEAARAAETVASIDRIIGWLANDAERDASIWGEALRNKIGRNRMSRLTDERLGQIAFVGIVNELLREREEIASMYGEIVRLPPPPCPEQRLPGDD